MGNSHINFVQTENLLCRHSVTQNTNTEPQLRFFKCLYNKLIFYKFRAFAQENNFFVNRFIKLRLDI